MTADPGEAVEDPADAADPADVAAVAADCETVDVALDEPAAGVATVTLSRPDARNALDATLRADLKRVCRAIDASDPAPDGDVGGEGDGPDGIRVVVLTGDPEGKAFVAGADVTELRERDARAQRRASERPRVYEAVADLRRPVIARVNGHALGGGCELATACDLRIAHERAKLGQPEITLGLMPGGGGTQRLPRLVGRGQATRLILTGELVDADEAAAIGLVDEVHGDDAFDDRIAEIAGSMAEKSPVALERALDAVRASDRLDLDAGIDYEAELFVGLFDTEDKDEGIDAFLEDREPEWSGR